MRFFSTLLALVAIPAILAIPAGTGSSIDLGLSSPLVASDVYVNSTLEARTFGPGHGRGKDHCKKELGRRHDDCQCFPGLGCHNDFDKCECGDTKNAHFVFNGRNDKPRCECSGEDQHYNNREKKCFCDDGFKGTYKNGGKLTCKPDCGDHQHYNNREKECVCDANFIPKTKNGKLVCKAKPQCGQNQHLDNKNKCVCDPKFDASTDKKGNLVCTPCKTNVCGLNQEFSHKKNKCVCKSGYNASYDKHHNLVCVVCPPTQSKRWNERSVETAAPQPIEFKTVEDALGCSASQIACEIGSTWTCFDASSNLASCGGCPGEGVDCSSIDAVDEVRCSKGQCIIDSCQKGYTVDLTEGVCVARGLLLQ